MPVLCDTQIRDLVTIEPFEAGGKRSGRISYGVSSYGYDIRVGPRFKIFTPTPRSGGVTIVDPKATWVALANPEPVTITPNPPDVGPMNGATPVTVGAAGAV